MHQFIHLRIKKRPNILTSFYNNQCSYLERTRTRPSWYVFSVFTSLITSSRTLLSAVDCLSLHVGHSSTVILISLFSWIQKYVVLKIYYIFLSMAWWKWCANVLIYFCINISLDLINIILLNTNQLMKNVEVKPWIVEPVWLLLRVIP